MPAPVVRPDLPEECLKVTTAPLLARHGPDLVPLVLRVAELLGDDPEVDVDPFPSWPESLLPQQEIAPPESAQLWP